MGNHQQHQQIQQKINSFQTVQKHSHFIVLKDQQGNQYIKFIYALSEDDHDQSMQIKENKSSHSIFNRNYLKYRFQCQNSLGKITHLPKIIAFGQQTQGVSLISCSTNKISFAIFQHPYKRTLKHDVQNRIASGGFFEQHQLLKLIKSVCQGLSQYFQHIKEWNQQILQKKLFVISQENIFIKNNGEFIISDIISHLNHIQQISKQEVTLSKASKSSSMTNLHAKVSSKKLKQKFFQLNFNNLASIIESIIFKFQCFSQPYSKNSHQSQSLSTALQSYRGMSKNPTSYSSQFDKILKELRQTFVSENEIINSVERILSSVHLPTPPQTSMDVTYLLQRKNSTEKSTVKTFGQTLKLSEINQFNVNQKRQTLGQLTQSTNIERNQQNKQLLLTKRFSHHLPSNNQVIHENKFLKKSKSKSKLRLSLKKDAQNIDPTKNSTTVAEYSLKRKMSNPKNMQHGSNQNHDSNNKQNNIISFKIHSIGFPQCSKIKQKQNAKNMAENILKSKLINNDNNEQSIFCKEKKKVFLKKPLKDQIINAQNQHQRKTQQASQSMKHLNPMSRKKNLGINKVLTLKSKQNSQVFKTIQKINNEVDLDMIENLSSIISNQNNTVSSYGIPVTDQFKTQNSLIEEQGCVGFNEIMELQIGNTKQKQVYGKNDKKSFENELFSPPCVKLSSYPSIQMVESILQRPEEKIPQFLKKFKLPEKHLVALNNIILTQKDVIFEESFQQSDFNSIRHSVPNILSIDEEISDLKKRNSKIPIQKIDQLVKKETQTQNFQSKLYGQDNPSGLSFEQQIKKQIIGLENNCDAFEKQLQSIEFSLVKNTN